MLTPPSTCAKTAKKIAHYASSPLKAPPGARWFCVLHTRTHPSSSAGISIGGSNNACGTIYMQCRNFESTAVKIGFARGRMWGTYRIWIRPDSRHRSIARLKQQKFIRYNLKLNKSAWVARPPVGIQMAVYEYVSLLLQRKWGFAWLSFQTVKEGT